MVTVPEDLVHLLTEPNHGHLETLVPPDTADRVILVMTIDRVTGK